MCTEPLSERNVALDQILAERRSHRAFTPDVPPRDAISRIIHAGLLAPYAAAAVGGGHEYFRQFFVLEKGSRSLKEASLLLMARVRTLAEELGHQMENDPALRARAESFSRRLAMIRKLGIVPGAGTAPYYLVVAERRGYPPLEHQSLAHCLENMWLKATALGLGFQLVSITSQMSDSPEFCRILGIPPGVWELAGCAVGCRRETLSPAIRPPVEDVTRWLE